MVLDSVSHIVRQGEVPDELRQLLYALVVRFKSRGVTSVLTLEAESMYSSERVTDGGYSPVADNIVMLRYAQGPGEFRPTVRVVKTRGSSHDWGTYYYSVSKGGIRIGDPVGGIARAKKGNSPASKRAKR